MAIDLKCDGCQSTLRAQDELAGRKVRCPRCRTVLLVHAQEAVMATADVEKTARGQIQTAEPDARRNDAIRGEPAAPAEQGPSTGQADTAAQPGRKYKPCPKCGGEGAKRVKWTAWGSFYGPALFTHVRCPDCACCYNGRTGRSNLLAAIVFVAAPLVGIAAIIAGIIYMLIQRGRLPV
jgi:hypothetical protein